MFLEIVAGVLGVLPSSIDSSLTFLQHGGDSLALIRLQQLLKERNINLSTSIICSDATIAHLMHLASQKNNLGDLHDTSSLDRKRSLVEGSSRAIKVPRRTQSPHCQSGIPLSSYSKCYAMTEMQSTLLYGSIQTPGTNVIYYSEYHLPENVASLKAAWRALTDTEPILRCSYTLDGAEARLVERTDWEFDWEECIVTDEECFQASARHQESTSHYFGSSFRVTTLQSNREIPGKSKVTWRVHHSLMDGYAHKLLLSRLESYLQHGTVYPGTPYVQFIAGLRALQATRKLKGDAFWTSVYKEHTNPATSIPFPSPDPATTIPIDPFPVLEIEIDLLEISKQCKSVGITPSTLYHTAWALTMAHFTGSRDVCFGTVLCGRSLPIRGIETVIGPTFNTLPCHVKLDTSQTLLEQMRYVFGKLIALAEYQWTTPQNGFFRDFQTAINVQISPRSLKKPTFFLDERPTSNICSNIPLQVEMSEKGQIRMHYNSKTFSQSCIKQLASSYKKAIYMIQDASIGTGKCLASLLGEAERGLLGELGNWNAQNDALLASDLVSLFSRVAMANPSAVALCKGNANLTYADLDAQSSLVAQQISDLVPSGAVVCVHADRSINWIVAIYAVLKIGAVYCPLDETLPMDLRDQFYISSTACMFLVGSVDDNKKKPPNCDLCKSVEELLKTKHVPHLDLVHKPSVESNAYLCFTSGSTGKPKGVMCRHRGLVAFQQDFTVRLQAQPGWKIAQFLSPSFDGSIHEIFSALSYGATLVLKDPKNPLDHLKQSDVTMLTPSVARVLRPHDFKQLKSVYLVGETVTPDVRDAWAAKTTLYNMYGPTEATCGATIKQLLPRESITLGRPVRATRIYILNKNLELIPNGTVGEVCLAGVQVAVGYINLPQETSKRFLPDPVNPHTGQLMYRTGDLGFWDERGELAFTGRCDREIKLRGFRIDMDSVEVQMLQASTEATSVAVTLGQEELVAQVCPESVDVAKLKKEIAKRMPSYALPYCILAVKSFPMTNAGKLDYNAIKKAASTVIRQDCTPVSLTLSRSSESLEEVFIASTKEVLSTTPETKIGPDTDIIEFGATSMTLIALSQRLSRLLGRQIPIRLLLKCRTARNLACHFKENLNDEWNIGKRLGEQGVAPIEEDWWHKYQVHSDTSAFNVNFVCKLSSLVDRDRLKQAWNTILARHKILRCRYRETFDSSIQRVYAEEPPTAKVMDYFDVSKAINTPFDLKKGDLIRVLICPSHMTVVISHIICDLTTLNILLKEVATVYGGQCPPHPTKHYDQTIWTTSPPKESLSFWSSYLDNAPTPSLFLQQRFKRHTWSGTSHFHNISDGIYSGMKSCTSVQKVTMQQLVLAATALALQDSQAAVCDITIGAPYLNRHSEQDQAVVGLFLEPLPIRVRYSASNLTDSYLHAVRAASCSALSHATSFRHLLSHLGTTIDYPNHPLFEAVVTFHDADRCPHLPIPGVQVIDTFTQGAKFKILMEFSVNQPDGLQLRIEYSSECFDNKRVLLIKQRVEMALECLISNIGFEETWRKLRGLRN